MIVALVPNASPLCSTWGSDNLCWEVLCGEAMTCGIERTLSRIPFRKVIRDGKPSARMPLVDSRLDYPNTPHVSYLADLISRG